MILLDGASLTLDQMLAIADDGAPVGLAPAAADAVDASRAVVARKAEGETPVYGINTGFGALAETAIPREALGQLQLNLLRSHAAGVGDPCRFVRCARRWRCGRTSWQRDTPASAGRRSNG
jgi:histidine ammonia-lyase